MFQLRIPTRPVRYAIVAAHTFREALEEISLDDKVNALADKVAELQERLEAIDERSIEEPTPEPKAKAKRRSTARKPSAKTKK